MASGIGCKSDGRGSGFTVMLGGSAVSWNRTLWTRRGPVDLSLSSLCRYRRERTTASGAVTLLDQGGGAQGKVIETKASTVPWSLRLPHREADVGLVRVPVHRR